MRVDVRADADEVAREAARLIAAVARTSVTDRGRFTLAVSGGRTPWKMLAALAAEEMPWPSVHLFQVDERLAPAGHPDRNLTHLAESLLAWAPIPAAHVHAMEVEDAEPEAAAARYGMVLREIAGEPPVLDLIHLGLGTDGHTASLIPGNAALEVAGSDVALTAGPYQGRRRMTLTYPMLDRARRVLWVVTGPDKALMLQRLLAGDRTIPAGRVRADHAILLADRAAAGAG
jgi:6-phosphogluconolactonase